MTQTNPYDAPPQMLPTKKQLAKFLNFVAENSSNMGDHAVISKIQDAANPYENGTYARACLLQLWRAWQEGFETWEYKQIWGDE